MKLRNLALAAAGMAFLAFTSLAQIATVEGIVKGVDGKPVEKADIKITRTDIKGEYKTKTDKKGHYVYMGLQYGGVYNIAVFVDGKQVDGMNGFRTSGDIKPVDFNLKDTQQANAAKQAAIQQAAQTGQVSKELERGMTADEKAALEKQIKNQSEQLKKRGELNDAFNAGMNAMQAKQWDQAVASFSKAAELDPKQPAVWAQFAEAYVKLAETKTGPEFDATIQKGMETYVKAIELKPDDAATHNNYALALSKAKKFPEMQAELQKAAELDPPNGGKYYYNLGAILVNSGQNEAASDAFKKAIELTPTYADAYYQYGVTLVAKASYGADGKVVPVPGTTDAFQKYLELQPNGVNAQAAKDMLATLGSAIETKYTDPNAAKKTTTTKKK